MAQVDQLFTTFESFCSFGSSRNLAGGSSNDLSGPSMDGARFAKFAKDAGLLNKTVTTTDIDIIFNKVKAKTARRINFDEFQQALKLVAEKRYPSKSPNDAFIAIVSHIVNQGARPIASGTSTSNDNITARLTDHTQYTGTHKHRFDENGRGLGINGRDQGPKTNDLKQITNREPANVRGVNVSAMTATIPINAPGPVKRDHQSITTASSERLDARQSLPKKTLPAPSKAHEPTPVSATNKMGSGSVFDRLTNTTQYTGTHKQRFNEDGTGRGLAGRDAPSKSASPGTYRGGNVQSLSQILRN